MRAAASALSPGVDAAAAAAAQGTCCRAAVVVLDSASPAAGVSAENTLREHLSTREGCPETC